VTTSISCVTICNATYKWNDNAITSEVWTDQPITEEIWTDVSDTSTDWQEVA
jgi:hypothetical protein